MQSDESSSALSTSDARDVHAHWGVPRKERVIGGESAWPFGRRSVFQCFHIYDACLANWGSDAFVFAMTNDKVMTYHHNYEKHFAHATWVATRGRGGTERDSKSQTKERPRVTLQSIALSYK